MSHATTTYCRICEAACGLEVTGTLTGTAPDLKLKPDRNHPVSGGFVCAKGTRFAEVAFHEKRLLRPTLGRGAARSQVSWERALDETADRLNRVIDRHGPHAVGMYIGNPLAFHALGQLSAVFFARALETRNVFTAGSQDCNNKFAAATILHGSPVIHPIPDLEHADLAVLLGTNPVVSQSSFVHLEGGALAFDRMKKRGARVIMVDVRQTESAKRWGELVRIRPGTDIALLLSLLRHFGSRASHDSTIEGLERLIELAETVPMSRAAQITGLPISEIEALADAIEKSDGTAFHMSVGVNQGPFGTLSYIVLQALSYVTGNYDRRGGSIFSPLGIGAARVMRRMGFFKRKATSRIGGHPTVFDSFSGGILADEITTEGAEKIRAMFVVAGDPIRSIPGALKLRKAFGSLESLISLDMFETATSELADVQLPATSWLERSDLALPGLPLQTVDLLQMTDKVIDRVGESRPEQEVFADLSLRMGRPLFGSRTISRLFATTGLADRLLPFVGRVIARLTDPSRAEYGVRIPVPEAGIYLGRGPMTEGRRVRFWHPDLAAERERLERWLEEQDRPRKAGYVLVGRRRRIGHNSWLHGGTREGTSVATAWIAPEDLASLGANEGDLITLRTASAEIRLPISAKVGVAPGTVVVPHGELDVNVNELIGNDRIERISGQINMTGLPVELITGEPITV